MKKLILSLAFLLLFAMPCSLTAQAAKSEVIDNGQLLNHRVFIPMRAVSQSFGVPVTWIADMKTVLLTQGKNKTYMPANFNRTVTHTPGVDVPYVFTFIDLDAPAQIRNGTMYVPLRFMSQYIQASISWNEQTKQATITKDGKQIIVHVQQPQVTVSADAQLTVARLTVLSDKLKEIADRTSIKRDAATYRSYFTNAFINSTLPDAGFAKTRPYSPPITTVTYINQNKAEITQSLAIYGPDLLGDTHGVTDRSATFIRNGNVWKVDRVSFSERSIMNMGVAVE
ncbi:stalk domain-containing protein [Paenibacillus sp. WLX1005]|uniref:stalk domain-containing protein n=1 Tax=Paenibacillus sp. WLX1005 TaxID=3243766 RepID=UPI0039844C55